MAAKLLVAAANWEDQQVSCTFVVTANGVALAALDRDKRIYELPAGTTTIEVSATPQVKPSPFWENKITFTVASSGTVSPPANKRAWVSIIAASTATAGLTLVTIRLNRFRDKTDDINKVLNGTI